MLYGILQSTKWSTRKQKRCIGIYTFDLSNSYSSLYWRNACFCIPRSWHQCLPNWMLAWNSLCEGWGLDWWAVSEKTVITASNVFIIFSCYPIIEDIASIFCFPINVNTFLFSYFSFLSVRTLLFYQKTAAPTFKFFYHQQQAQDQVHVYKLMEMLLSLLHPDDLARLDLSKIMPLHLITDICIRSRIYWKRSYYGVWCMMIID